MIAVTIKGAETISRVLVRLGPAMEKTVNKTNGQWLRDVRKSAKLRAPRMTGEMADSIKVRKGKKYWNLTMDSPYGRFQEMGYRGHLINSNASTRNSLGTFAAAYGIPNGVSILIPSASGKYFMRNAIEKNIPKLMPMIEQSTGKTLKKVGGKK